MKMDIEAFDFHLPEELIAQTPLNDRTASRMLVLNKSEQTISHERFTDLKRHFKKGDCLVLNNTKVLPARLYGHKKDTGAKIEILLLREINNNKWEALTRPAKKVPAGTEIVFGHGLLTAKCVDYGEQGIRVFDLKYDGILYEILDQLGEMPLPPYIKEKLDNQDRYQTHFAEKEGSAAAPTAGLHFTKEYMEELKIMGVEIHYVTLHVGLGTFRPVTVSNIEEHTMHSEYYEMNKETAEKLEKARSEGRRIFAVGTTVTRTLETIVGKFGHFKEDKDWTDIFIYPPYKFSAVDGIITNFHLPKSTLLMLVSAFTTRELTLKAYEEAVRKHYRFFSFGDCMLILP